MKRIIAAFTLVCGLATASEAAPLLIRWPLYKPNSVPVERLVLYRSVNAGPVQPYLTIWDLQTTAFTDNAVKWSRRYCYEIRAITEGGVASPPSNRACATPLK